MRINPLLLSLKKVFFTQIISSLYICKHALSKFTKPVQKEKTKMYQNFTLLAIKMQIFQMQVNCNQSLIS